MDKNIFKQLPAIVHPAKFSFIYFKIFLMKMLLLCFPIKAPKCVIMNLFSIITHFFIHLLLLFLTRTISQNIKFVPSWMELSFSFYHHLLHRLWRHLRLNISLNNNTSIRSFKPSFGLFCGGLWGEPTGGRKGGVPIGWLPDGLPDPRCWPTTRSSSVSIFSYCSASKSMLCIALFCSSSIICW